MSAGDVVTIHPPRQPAAAKPKAPETPALFREEPHGCEVFATLTDLGRRLHELRDGFGLEITVASARFDDTPRLDGFNVWLRRDDGRQRWLGFAWTPGTGFSTLHAALKSTEAWASVKPIAAKPARARA